MSRFQRPLPLPKSPRSSFVRRSPITLTRRPYRCSRSPFRILRSTGNCSWNFRLGLKMKSGRPGTKRGMARCMADRAIDLIRDRFAWEAIEYGSTLGLSLSIPDEFRELAEKEL